MNIKKYMKKILLIALLTFASTVLFAQKALKVGDDAPMFNVKDNNGKQLDLKKILKEHKSVVLFFYRGQWCPYCNKQIKELEENLQSLTSKGAFVIGVSPETDENVAKTVDKTKATFSIISDKGYSIMKAYKVDYAMEQGLADRYKKNGLDIAMANGSTENVLPVPATYIIGKNGKIKYAFYDTNYKKRASIKDLEDNL